jgi:FixJ family two-component response regulator
VSVCLLSTLAAAREINRRRPEPAILLTGRHDVESLAWAAGSPVVKFLIKPVKENALRAAIEAVVSPTVSDTQEPPSSR